MKQPLKKGFTFLKTKKYEYFFPFHFVFPKLKKTKSDEIWWNLMKIHVFIKFHQISSDFGFFILVFFLGKIIQIAKFHAWKMCPQEFPTLRFYKIISGLYFPFFKGLFKRDQPPETTKTPSQTRITKNEVSGSYWSPSPSQFSTHPASKIQIVFPHLLIQIKSVHGVSCMACLFSKTLECLWSKATKKWNCLGPLKLYKWVAVKPSVLLHFVKCLYCPFLKGCVVKLLLCGQLEIFDLQKKYFSINGLFGICHFHQKNTWTVCHFIFSLHNFSSCSQKMPLEEKNMLQSKPFVKGQVLTIFQWSSGCIPFFKDHPNHGICNPLRRVWLHLPMSGLAVPTCLILFPKDCGSAKFGQGRARCLQTSTLSWCLDHHQRVLQSLPFCKGRPFPQGLSSWWWSRHLTTLERYPRTSGAP